MTARLAGCIEEQMVTEASSIGSMSMSAAARLMRGAGGKREGGSGGTASIYKNDYGNTVWDKKL